MNRLKKLFRDKKKKILSIYFTAGFPNLADTGEILEALQEGGADLIEIGMPYSDPLADGPVIQESSLRAIENGMTISMLFDQLKDFSVKRNPNIPFILMGYLNPVMQYGLDKFLKESSALGIDGLILPDLPLDEFEHKYSRAFKKYGLRVVFLVTPETTEQRIQKIDKLTDAFIYAVSSSSITGGQKDLQAQEGYFKRLKDMQLRNPVVVGFGIRDRATFQAATKHTDGAIIGTAYIDMLGKARDFRTETAEFLNSIL